MRLLIFLALVFSSCPCFAQRLSGRGSADQFRAQMEHTAEWNAAKKLTVGLGDASQPPTNQGDNPDNLDDGQVGNLSYWAFSIASVVDDENAILRLGNDNYWLAGFPTRGLADEQSVRLIGPLKCVGNKQYKTVLGATKTVKAFQFVTREDIEKQERADAEAEEAKYWATWHSKAGTTIHAKFVEWKSGKIKLQTKDNRTLIVDVSAFTDEDAEKLRSLNRQLRNKK